MINSTPSLNNHSDSKKIKLQYMQKVDGQADKAQANKMDFSELAAIELSKAKRKKDLS